MIAGVEIGLQVGCEVGVLREDALPLRGDGPIHLPQVVGQGRKEASFP